MNIQEFKKQANILLKMSRQHINIILAGPPGIGKSQAVEQVAHDMGFEMLIVHCVTMDPTDMKGLPVTWVDEEGHKRAAWIPFGDLLKIVTADKPLLVFFDDFGQAPASVQAAIMQLIEARQLNGYKVSDEVRFVFATNRREDAAAVKAILSTIKSRGLILEIEPSVEGFVEFIATDKNCHPVVKAFAMWVHHTPAMGDLFDYVPTKDMSNTCLPRTLHRSGAVLMEYHEAGIINELHPEVIYGLIGKTRGAELMGFLQIYEDLPDPVQFLKDPKPELIPERVDVKFAFMSRIQGMINEDNADNAMKFVDMLPLEYSSLFVSWCVAEAEAKAKKEGKRDLSQISHPLLNTTGFRDFAMKNHHIITYGVSR